ncbi:hypothetical protein PENANT_c006G01550 [Penicillium antarcticum]|uniref:Uncharacterized protein n=1 Tax=Penicillium antarcticum TaxID=416450 RepID=A0A1V6QDJ7_9EURO|nr:uncharacterized protein N7508_009216 [Penicillium antarcticum]KAJ5294395.1 hypothetical protein N7508_009216 [Penicillium antarcticum]OQD87274.1 hypothetical protein PENANT_c006G01550 [Penicillium antarcticum]
MPDEPRRVILEKSKTVRRRYQRSNQRFKFTASQVERIDREEEREKKARQLRDKEKKRIANKKRKAEQEARTREERKRRGIPDPNLRVPSSQPLLSMFLGAKKSSPTPPRLETSTTETETEVGSDGGDTEPDSAAGDTEADSDALDDLDEELENDLSELQGPDISEIRDAGVSGDSEGDTEEDPNLTKDDDEFSDCSAFDDEDVLKEVEVTAVTPPFNDETKPPSIPKPDSFYQAPPVPALDSSFGDSFQFDASDFLEAEAAIITQTINDGTIDHSTPKQSASTQAEEPRRMPTLVASESFRDDNADFLESHGHLLGEYN